MINNTNGCSVSTVPYFDPSLLHAEFYYTSRLGILTKSQLLKTFNDANNYQNPIKNLCLHHLTSQDTYFRQLDRRPPTKKNELGKDCTTVRGESVDCQTHNKNDADHIMRAMNTPSLHKSKLNMKSCLSSIGYKNHKARSEHSCGFRYCPHCTFVKYSKKLKAFKLGLEKSSEKIKHFWWITIKTDLVPLQHKEIRQRHQDLSKGLSKAFTSSKYVRSTKNKKGVITGSSRAIECVYRSVDQVNIHAHVGLSLEGLTSSKGSWLTREKLDELFKDHIPGYTEFHITQFRDQCIDTGSISIDTIMSKISYMHKFLGKSTMDRFLSTQEIADKGINQDVRISESSIRKQPLKFYRELFVATKNLRSHAVTGTFKRILKIGKTEYDLIKEVASSKEQEKQNQVYANWRQKHLVDKNNEFHSCGEFVLDTANANLLVKEVEKALSTRVYMQCDPLALIAPTIEYLESKDFVSDNTIKSTPKEKTKLPYKPKERYCYYDSQLIINFKEMDSDQFNSQDIDTYNESANPLPLSYTTKNKRVEGDFN
jgi:hypothetical protein